MNKLHTFGCSYTQDFNDNKIEAYIDYCNFRGGTFPLTWPEILSNKLNLSLKNYGKGGGGNNLIFQTLCNNINEIKKDDIVIIQWTYVHRYMWVDIKKNNWNHFGAGPLNGDNSISETTHEEISYNRTHPLYVNQIYEWMKLIDVLSKSIGFELYYWSGDRDVLYPLDESEKKNKKYLLGDLKIPRYETIFAEIFKLGGKTIKEETNNLVNDLHFGESAHKIMGELFYNHIENYNNKII
jgi:hypothetical protein